MNNKLTPGISYGLLGIIFWLVFILFMGLGLPILIHYNQSDWKYNYEKSVGTAFFYLGLGLFLWLTLILLFYQKMLHSFLVAKRHFNHVLKHGTRLNGTILKVTKGANNNGMEEKMLLVEFKNLGGNLVEMPFNFTDTKPTENRYVAGQSISLIADDHPKRPLITLAQGFIGFNRPIITVIVVVLLILVIMPIVLLILGQLYESKGYGWRYLSFTHPFVMNPIMGLFFFGLFIFFRRFFNGSSGTHRLFLHGRQVVANIVSATETGTEINNMPLIRVKVSFEHQGEEVIASFKKIYGLVQLHQLVNGAQIKILYNPENPQELEPYDIA